MSTEATTTDSVVGVDGAHRSQPYRATAGAQRALQDVRFEPLYRTRQHHDSITSTRPRHWSVNNQAHPVHPNTSEHPSESLDTD